MSNLKWTLPKKWEIVDTELFVDKEDDRYSYRKTTKYLTLTIRFCQKKYWWSKPTFFDKKIACEMFENRKLTAIYNDWFWLPEMTKFEPSTFAIDSVFGESSWSTAKRFRDYIGTAADAIDINRNDGWQKLLDHHKEVEALENNPTFKETPSAYR